MISVSDILLPLLQLWYLLPIILIVAFFKTPYGKGIVGEFLVNSSAKISLDKNKYHTINNVTLPTEDGTTQIDHIIVSEFGIFIIETKNYKGWIFGDEHSKFWTQQIYNSKQKFQNPLHQNYKHIKTLQQLLNIDEEKIFSVIVFAGDSTFKTKMPPNVVHGIQYVKYIKSKNDKIIPKENISKIISQIKSDKLSNSFKTHKEHIEHVNEIIDRKSNSCPKCGSELILRVAQKGEYKGKEFLGCSNFPKCKFIKVI